MACGSLQGEKPMQELVQWDSMHGRNKIQLLHAEAANSLQHPISLSQKVLWFHFQSSPSYLVSEVFWPLAKYQTTQAETCCSA